MSGKPIGIGLIGTGGIAFGAHLPALKKLEEEGKVKLVAAADVNEVALDKAVKEYGIQHKFTDYREMLKLDSVDAVDICTPNFLHKQPTIDSANAGKHVIVEKPIALNAIEGQAMVDACKKNKVKFQVALPVRFGSSPQAVKRMINDGRIGEIYYARAQALRRRGVPSWGVFTQKDKQGGGPLIDIGVHVLDLTLWLMDYPEPVSVSGSTYTKFGKREGIFNMWGPWDHKNFTVEDFAVGLVKFKNGATLVLESSFVANIEREVMQTQIMGTEGGALLEPGSDANTRIYREESGTLTDTHLEFLPKSNAHELELRAFVKSLLEDSPIEVPGEQGVMVSRILDSIYASSEQGKEIVL